MISRNGWSIIIIIIMGRTTKTLSTPVAGESNGSGGAGGKEIAQEPDDLTTTKGALCAVAQPAN